MPEPFIFMTAVQSVQLTGLRVSSLADLYSGLSEVDGSSIYHHTHRFYQAHSFLGETPLSDFAFWVGENLRESVVAESMASLDLRDYPTMGKLRSALLATLEPLKDLPGRWERRVPPGLEFHFCRSVSLILPTGLQAWNLEDFIHSIERLDTSCLYYHLIEAPLHLEADRTYPNDFSEWLDTSLGLKDLAGAVAALDPYRRDLEGLREELLALLRPNRWRRMVDSVLNRQEPVSGVVTSFLKRWKKGD